MQPSDKWLFFLLGSRFAHHSVLLAKHSEFSSRNCLHVCVYKFTHTHIHTHTHIYTLYTASAKYIYYIYIYINIRNISPTHPPPTLKTAQASRPVSLPGGKHQRKKTRVPEPVDQVCNTGQAQPRPPRPWSLVMRGENTAKTYRMSPIEG